MGIRDFYEGRLAVYVLALENLRACKIGISVDPGARCRNIQTSQDETVSVFWAGRLPRKDAQKLEREIHKELQTTLVHKRGEWYSIDPIVAVRAIENKAESLGFKLSPDLYFGALRDLQTPEAA